MENNPAFSDLKSGDSEQVKGQKTELSTDFYSKFFYLIH